MTKLLFYKVMYFPTKMFGISLYLQAFDFFGYFFNFYIDSTLSFCFLPSFNIALNFVCLYVLSLS